MQSDAPALDRALLSAWTSKPVRPDVFAAGAVDAEIDNSGPPIEECAIRLRQLEADYEGLPPAHRYFKERRLVLCSLLVLYGRRRGALHRLRAADYVADKVLTDSVRGPALRLFPRKTRRAAEEYWLPLPVELAGWIERWLDHNGYSVGEKGAPMFPSTRGSGQALTADGLRAIIAGKPNGRVNLTRLCGATHSRVYGEFRTMRSRAWWAVTACAISAGGAAHSQRVSRKASSRSGGL